MTITIDNVPGFLLLILILSFLPLIVLFLLKSVRPSYPKIKTQHSSERPNPRSSAVQVGDKSWHFSTLAPKLNELPTEMVFIHAKFRVQHTPEQLEAWNKLTPRKVEVALCVARGLSNAEVATELKIQKSTVEGYLKEIYRALDLRSRTELANFVRDLALETTLPSQNSPP
jgi:DNA-binding CsgD family transcriptional regulator